MMLTRCPYCGTTFRVTPEQLKVRQGQVRCGKCRRIFDALRALVDNTPAVAAPPSPPVSTSEPEPTAKVTEAVATATPVEPALPETPTSPSRESPVAEHHGLTWTIVQPAPLGTYAPKHEPAAPSGFAAIPVQTPDTPSSSEPEALSPADISAHPGFTPLPMEGAPTEIAVDPFKPVTDAPTPATAAEEQAGNVPRGDEAPVEVAPEADTMLDEITIDELPGPPIDEPSAEEVDERGPPTVPQPDTEIISHARTEPDILIEPESAPDEDTTRLRNPRVDSLLAELNPPTILDLHEPTAKASVGWPWVVGIILASLAITAQLALHYRTDLIAANPELRPMFVTVCEILGCRIELPHRIDMISIDSSDLAPDDKKAGTLYLTTTLRNRARFAQAWPYLEITLTDAQGRALLRRALAPAEYLLPEDSPSAGFPALSERVVLLTLSAPDVPAVGYRLYIFHP